LVRAAEDICLREPAEDEIQHVLGQTRPVPPAATTAATSTTGARLARFWRISICANLQQCYTYDRFT
jgi:hypothetical protein